MAAPGGREPPKSVLVPCVLLKRGEVYRPSDDGPVPARQVDGSRYDPFEVVDRLSVDYPLVYLVDLDGVERAEPQLDFLQELSREVTLWVDGGVRVADQAIDILVAGAQRAVLSSASLTGPRELRRAWKLSTELVFELEVNGSGLVASGDWETSDPLALARQVRASGPDHIVLSPRGIDPDWTLLRSVAAEGPTWIDGSFSASDVARATYAGARGGIFHLDAELRGPATSQGAALR